VVRWHFQCGVLFIACRIVDCNGVAIRRSGAGVDHCVVDMGNGYKFCDLFRSDKLEYWSGLWRGLVFVFAGSDSESMLWEGMLFKYWAFCILHGKFNNQLLHVFVTFMCSINVEYLSLGCHGFLGRSSPCDHCNCKSDGLPIHHHSLPGFRWLRRR
jgi:hypothetical protein